MAGRPKNSLGWRGILALLAGWAALAGAQPAWFVQDGALVRFDGQEAVKLAAPAPEVRVREFLGVVADGAPVVKLDVAAGHRHDADCGHEHDPALADIVELDEAGRIRRVVAENAFRAFPSPDGTRVAVVDADYSVHVLDGERRRSLALAERTVLVAWSPDARRLCLTVYPPDWRFNAASTADGPDDFLRLINNDLVLYDLETDRAERLTDAPGYDYGGLFSPDGASIFFISSRAGRGAFHRIDLATRRIEQLTNLEPGSYDVPVGRSQTLVWLPALDAVAYEAQETPELSSIRVVGSDGGRARKLGLGTQPRVLEGGRALAYLDADGRPTLQRGGEVAP